MPASIGDYLADALHPGTEEHSAAFLLLIHLPRRTIRDGGDVLHARTTGPGPNTRNSSRAVPANFVELNVGHCHQGHVQQERGRFAAKRQSNPNKARLNACCRCLSTFKQCNRNSTMRPSARLLAMPDRSDNPGRRDERPSILPAHLKGWTDIAGCASSHRAAARRRTMNSS